VNCSALIDWILLLLLPLLLHELLCLRMFQWGGSNQSLSILLYFPRISFSIIIVLLSFIREDEAISNFIFGLKKKKTRNTSCAHFEEIQKFEKHQPHVKMKNHNIMMMTTHYNNQS
jgi:hypothetical protein